MTAINIPTGSAVRLAACVETSQGVLPATPTFKVKRVENLKPQLQRDTLKSSEITTSRQIIGMRLGMYKATHQYGGNLLLGGFDDEIACGMNNTWQTAPSTTAALQSIAASQTIVRASGSWITDGFQPGMYVATSGFTNSANNNAIVQINSVTATVLTVTVIKPASGALVDEASAAGRTVAMIGKYITTGQASTSLPSSLAIEHYIPGNNTYELYSGMCVDKITLTAKPNDMVKVTFDFVGLNRTLGTSANGSTYSAAPTNSPMDAFTAPLYIGGVAAGNITTLTMNLQNGRKAADGVIGSKVAPAVIEGTNEITFDFTAYFSDQSLANAFLNETNIALDIPFFDANGTDFVKLRFGNVKILSADEDIKLNSGVMLTIKGQALADPNTATQTGTQYGTNILIQRSNLV